MALRSTTSTVCGGTSNGGRTPEGEGLAGGDLGPEGGVGREHVMEAVEMEPGARDECGRASHEFQRGHHQMGGSIAVRVAEVEALFSQPKI